METEHTRIEENDINSLVCRVRWQGLFHLKAIEWLFQFQPPIWGAVQISARTFPILVQMTMIKASYTVMRT